MAAIVPGIAAADEVPGRSGQIEMQSILIADFADACSANYASGRNAAGSRREDA